MRAEREARGWTQLDLAEKLKESGISLHSSAIAKIELRDVDRPRVIRLDEAQAIANLFGLLIDEMFDTEDQRIRSVGNRMRTWLERIIKEVEEEGSAINYEVEELISVSDPLDVEAVSNILVSEYFGSFVRSTTSDANNLLSQLRQPSRRAAIDWPHEVVNNADDSAEA
ncbi:UNVERIFIED_ORG: helix-turn-helix protein [Nocardia globerula]|uniref:Helix-turn-helix protein n=1 Tax=Nocardia globerula TaxID=1818 RepID=A0A652YYB4_NOCGL|nr:helix-turn-helix protein [Rhodococcus globerulus]